MLTHRTQDRTKLSNGIIGPRLKDGGKNEDYASGYHGDPDQRKLRKGDERMIIVGKRKNEALLAQAQDKEKNKGKQKTKRKG